jgi:hypothetical protein
MENSTLTLNGLLELKSNDYSSINGGGFAYDFGFFIRELIIDVVNGGSAPGYIAACTDFSLYYRPANK